MTLPCGGTACSKCGKCKGDASCRTMDGARKAANVTTGVAAGGMALAPFTGGASLITTAIVGVGGAAIVTQAAAHLCKCK
ncbi:unnamed protein product [Adineta steineri]|uniref:Uncharacterized protein n=1 Tax=Adineta steineri TaxID=433720 RepID=A0A819TUA9_9BILA|nr:unnamed protein product [Adineta steineri]CAF4070036.1 unnamed protein product [Adineta steineri]